MEEEEEVQNQLQNLGEEVEVHQVPLQSQEEVGVCLILQSLEEEVVFLPLEEEVHYSQEEGEYSMELD